MLVKKAAREKVIPTTEAERARQTTYYASTNQKGETGRNSIDGAVTVVWSGHTSGQQCNLFVSKSSSFQVIHTSYIIHHTSFQVIQVVNSATCLFPSHHHSSSAFKHCNKCTCCWWPCSKLTRQKVLKHKLCQTFHQMVTN